MNEQLFLHEEFMLLALRKEAGTMTSSESLALPLAAALLSELLLHKKIELDDAKKRNKLVNLIDATPIGEPLLDEALQKIKDAKRRGSLRSWVMRLARIKKIKRRIALQLCKRGVLHEDEDRVLLIFKRKIYPEVNPQPERRLVERIHKAIFTDTDSIDPRVAVIIALAHHTHLLGKSFAKKDLKPRKKRIKQIAEGQLTAVAAKEVMDAVIAAVFAAVIIPS